MRPRPPWWPSSEPWPPPQPAWRHHQARFIWRAALALGLLAFLAVGGCIVAFVLAAFAFDGAPPAWPRSGAPFFFFLRFVGFGLVLLVIGGLAAGFLLRRVSLPVGAWLEAAGRVEAGDYSARAPESGPREVRRFAEAFNAMTARLEQTDQQRRQLLADVTHELRTPLTVIQGQIEGILDGVYPADQAHLTPILEETHVLARLIDDLRTLSHAENGVLSLQREPVDLGELANECATTLRPRADLAGVRLEVNSEGALPLIEGDPVRLREVLANVIGNALRYTTSGDRVTIAVERANGGVTVAVRDTGAGIDPAVLPRIFDRFYRSSDSSGSGLGLAIARNLVQAHGGTIAADSRPGVGTTITVTFPAAATRL
ncbi:MAG: ATP-binding protein [Dehalococcoidia bacterium]